MCTKVGGRAQWLTSFGTRLQLGKLGRADIGERSEISFFVLVRPKGMVYAQKLAEKNALLFLHRIPNLGCQQERRPRLFGNFVETRKGQRQEKVGGPDESWDPYLTTRLDASRKRTRVACRRKGEDRVLEEFSARRKANAPQKTSLTTLQGSGPGGDT